MTGPDGSQTYEPNHPPVQDNGGLGTNLSVQYDDLDVVKPTVAMWSNTVMDDIQGYIYTYVPPVIFCWGLICNAISFFVLRRKTMMQSSTVFYMAALVTANSVALIVGLAADWLATASGLKPIQMLSDSSCRIWYFLLGLVLHFPTWIVTAMCIDRVMCVFHARKAASKCTTFRAKVVTIFIFIGLFCVSIHAMWSFALYDKTGKCQHGVRNHYFHIIIWPWIQAALCSYIPLILMALFSIILLIGTIKNGHLVRVLPDMNKTVLLISIMYFLFATPAAGLNLTEYFLPMSYKQNNSVRAATYLARAVTTMTLFANYGLTFLCLLVSSRSFRKELMVMVRCCCEKCRGRQPVPTTEMNGNGRRIEIIEEHDLGTQL